jgi:hypothetical protein
MKIDMPDDVPDEVSDQVCALVRAVLNRPDEMLHRDFGGQTRHFSCDLDVRWDEDYKIAELNVTLVEKDNLYLESEKISARGFESLHLHQRGCSSVERHGVGEANGNQSYSGA